MIAEILNQLAQHLRTEILAALIHIAYGSHELRSRRVLQDITRGSYLKTLHQIILILIHREEENLGFRPVLLDLPRRFKRRKPRHADVNQHDVGSLVARLLDRVSSIGRLPDYFEVILHLEQAANTLTEQRMVIHKQ